MKELDLYKFIKNNSIEYHWTFVSSDKNEVIIFVNIYNIEEFNKLLGTGILEEEGMECNMKSGYFAFKMNRICEYFDIKLEDIFEDKNI